MFENIIGHDRNKVKFRKVTAENIRQAYLFVGEDSIGKKTFAIELANKFIGNERNMLIIEPENGNISVDVIRSAEENFIPTMPLGGLSYKKFIIIDNAECLNEASSNSLLKVIEEPPAWCVFIFITNDLNRMLDTIKSRCAIEKFHFVEKALVDKFIMDNLDITDDMLLLFLSTAIGGKMGKLMEMRDSETVLNDYKLLYDTALKVYTLKTVKGVKPVSECFSLDNKNKVLEEISGIMTYYFSRYMLGDNGLFDIITLMEETYKNIDRGGSVNLSIELMLMKIVKLNKWRNKNE